MIITRAVVGSLVLSLSLYPFSISHALPSEGMSAAPVAAAKVSPDRDDVYRVQKGKEQRRRKRRRAIKKICRRYLGGHGGKENCGARELRNKLSRCDADADGLRNRDEVRVVRTSPFVADTDGDGLLDSVELCTTGTKPRKPDSDGDGIPDGGDPDSGPGSGDGCDQEGNTSGFGIPQGVVGNIFRGEAEYETSCSGCHPAVGGQRGTNLKFPALDQTLKGGPMSLSLQTQQVADLTAYLNSGNCTILTPTPTPIPPTPQPTLPPNGDCDAQGNTTAFGIPAGLVGNIAQGASQFQLSCSTCHATDRGTDLLFPALKSAVNGAPMNIRNLSDQQMANLTAYLNRYNCGGDSPTPTPTPANPIDRGRIVFDARCLSCHSRPEEFRELTRNKLDREIREERQMQGISLTDQEYQDLFAYFGSLSGGGGDDD